MNNYHLINNKTNLKVFDTFNSDYGNKAISEYPEFVNILINAVGYKDSQFQDELCFEEYDTFGFYFNYLADPKWAEIIINEDTCLRQGLSEQEMLAAIAHELGHIRYTDINKIDKQDQIAEIDSDDFACCIGLGKPLTSLLTKLIQYNGCPEELSKMIKERLSFIAINPNYRLYSQLYI